MLVYKSQNMSDWWDNLLGIAIESIPDTDIAPIVEIKWPFNPALCPQMSNMLFQHLLSVCSKALSGCIVGKMIHVFLHEFAGSETCFC